MRKIIFLLSVLMLPVNSYAATLHSDSFNRLYYKESDRINPIQVTAEEDGEITKEHGINILLPKGPMYELLWDDRDFVDVVWEGAALTDGYVDAHVKPQYSNDYTVVNIPIKTDWPAGMSGKIVGLRLRAYDRNMSPNEKLKFDLNGDLEPDAVDINATYVSDKEVYVDTTPPYPPSDLKYEILKDGHQIKLTWNNPPDFDFAGIVIERTLVRGTTTIPHETLRSGEVTEQFVDSDVRPTDNIEYVLFSKDTRNQSERVTLNIDVYHELNPEQPDETTEEEETPAESPEASESEADKLDRLFNYYKTRYFIKCLPSGNPVPENDSACLWAKIDLAYAQQILNRSDVSTAFSERELYLIGLRLPYSQDRHQTQCIEASEPANYCASLGEALERAQYFLD